jgi:hypothetical protein
MRTPFLYSECPVTPIPFSFPASFDLPGRTLRGINRCRVSMRVTRPLYSTSEVSGDADAAFMTSCWRDRRDVATTCVPVTMPAIASIRHGARSYRPQGTNAVGNGARSDRAHPYVALAVEI